MLLNKVLRVFQNLFLPAYKRSYFLKKIDWLIFANIIFVILTSLFSPSDYIAYFAIFGIILTVVKLVTKPDEKCLLSGGDKFLLLYFLIVLISVAGSSLLYLSFKGFIKTVIYIGFYISVVHYLKDNRDKIKYILIALAFSVFAESVIAVKQNFMSVSEISGWQDISHLNPEEVMTRVYGSLKPYNPNLFGGYMLSVLPSALILVYLPFINKHYKTALAGFCIFCLGALSIVLTGCRGAYVGLFAELIILTLLTYRFLKPFYKKIFSILTGCICTIAALLMVSISSVRARIFSIFAFRNDSSNSFRFNVYHSCVDMFKDNWLLGIGVGNQNFREIYGLYMKTGFDALSAYNIYLETAVESGIFALIAFLGFICMNLSRAIRYILRKKNINSIYLLIASVSILGMLIHGFVDTVFFRPQLQFVFWIMIGIIRVLTTPQKAGKVYD